MTDWSIPIEKMNIYLSELKPVKHNMGRSIIMPSGSGKSYWMKNLQHTSYKGWNAIPKKSFIDSDPLMISVGAMPPLRDENGKLKSEDFSGGLTWKNDMEEICTRCDKVIIECKKRGLWVMGASWWEAKIIDAFVILPAELNKKYLQGKRDVGEGFDENYYEREVLQYINNTIKPTARENNIPIFDSIEGCARYIIHIDQKLKM